MAGGVVGNASGRAAASGRALVSSLSPGTLGQRQRLYSTVMNDVRMDREQAAPELNGDLAGTVVLDLELLRIRPPAAATAPGKPLP